MSEDVQDWTVELSLPHLHLSGPARESLIGAPNADLIGYGRILAAEHPYGSQERELLTALAEALAARQPVEILAQMGRLQAKERTARERVQVLERQLADRDASAAAEQTAADAEEEPWAWVDKFFGPNDELPYGLMRLRDLEGRSEEFVAVVADGRLRHLVTRHSGASDDGSAS